MKTRKTEFLTGAERKATAAGGDFAILDSTFWTSVDLPDGPGDQILDRERWVPAPHRGPRNGPSYPENCRIGDPDLLRLEGDSISQQITNV